MLDLIWLVPLLPIIGVVINGFFGRKMTLKAVGLVACTVMYARFHGRCWTSYGPYPKTLWRVLPLRMNCQRGCMHPIASSENR